MCADIADSYAHWNQRLDDNMSCWTCEHFQRYDEDGSKNWCEGECRKEAPLNSYLTFHNPNWYLSDTFFPYVPWGNISWCSGYQVSLEENIPEPPPEKADCENQNRDDWILPPEINTGNEKPIPNKKPTVESCWYCIHFQRQAENPTNDPADCKGYCRIQPPETYYRVDPDWLAGKLNIDPTWTLIINSPIIWCSRWKRNPNADELPAPPEQNGVLCGDPP